MFDLDTHQITGFALKPWAEQFIQVRAAHDGAVSCLEGFEAGRLLTAAEAMERFLELLYAGQKLGRMFGLSDRRVRSIIEHERKHREY